MPATVTRQLLLAGCGKMGGAMLDGWLKSGITQGGVAIVDPALSERYASNPSVTCYDNVELVPETLDPEIVLLAVKPQQMDTILDAYARFTGPDTLFISIAAGKTLSCLAKHLGAKARILRAMPNTPAAIGQGITVACGNDQISPAQAELALALLRAVGEAELVTDENLINIVTALSGGGPAYVFHLIETMAEAGKTQGLPAELAERLALVTVAGAGQLALKSGDDPSRLRMNVTSPGGTTQEALNILMQADNGLADLMQRAISAATRRSRELAG